MFRVSYHKDPYIYIYLYLNIYHIQYLPQPAPRWKTLASRIASAFWRTCPPNEWWIFMYKVLYENRVPLDPLIHHGSSWFIMIFSNYQKNHLGATHHFKQTHELRIFQTTKATSGSPNASSTNPAGERTHRRAERPRYNSRRGETGKCLQATIT